MIDVAHGARIEDLDIATMVVVVEIRTRDSGTPLFGFIQNQGATAIFRSGELACLTVVDFSRLGRFDTI